MLNAPLISGLHFLQVDAKRRLSRSRMNALFAAQVMQKVCPEDEYGDFFHFESLSRQKRVKLRKLRKSFNKNNGRVRRELFQVRRFGSLKRQAMTGSYA